MQHSFEGDCSISATLMVKIVVVKPVYSGGFAEMANTGGDQSHKAGGGQDRAGHDKDDHCR